MTSLALTYSSGKKRRNRCLNHYLFTLLKSHTNKIHFDIELYIRTKNNLMIY